MNRFFLVCFLIILMVSCKTKVVEPDPNELIKRELVKKIDNYVNGVDSFVYHVNASSKDFDSISVDELKNFKKKKRITKNVSEKNTTFYRQKIVKVKHKDYLENNFVKLKAFYFDEDELVCIKIYELFPSEEISSKAKVYKRVLYFKKNELLLDSSNKDEKYETNELLNFGVAQLEEEYQSKLND
ncbi:hypothetical protein SAMN05444411_10640 [Lutibacter oricola]|uniref:Lipoprotein n=1 Tax=Lutibacter oricola TaxID=762486 RepID=A0A1H3C462_9FLAO|nr:hypothetical protein [Lutibacter oricola]SDX48688.1 hypothetical protein SAMN05444411_10640 [Lutibacter oricola]